MINNQTKMLVQAIKGTPEFAALKQAKFTINSNKDLKKKIEDFKNKERNFFASNLSTKEAESKSIELKKHFEQLSAIPEVSNFLKSERAFTEMIQKFYQSINDSIELELKS